MRHPAKLLGLAGGAVLALALTCPPRVQAATWHVPTDAPTIQAAIDAAADGDIIALADQTFTGPGNRDLSFAGKAITIGSASGDAARCIIDCQGSGSDPHFGFSFTEGEGGASRLENVTIRGGAFATGYHGGGAVFMVGASPAITGCVFRNNFSPWDGGALHCLQGSPTISDCVFEDNFSGSRGGAAAFDSDQPDSAPVLTRCLFRNNEAVFGGAVFVRAQALPLLEFCTFSANSASGSGGGIFCSEAALTVRNCTFSRNSSVLEGGAIGGDFVAGATVENTLITHSLSGGAVACLQDDSINLSCCLLYNNVDGDWTDCVGGQYPGDGNLAESPQLCSPTPDYDRMWVLQEDSPCAPDQTACGLIGAWDVGCGSTPTKKRTLGGVRSLYR